MGRSSLERAAVVARVGVFSLTEKGPSRLLASSKLGQCAGVAWGIVEWGGNEASTIETVEREGRYSDRFLSH